MLVGRIHARVAVSAWIQHHYHHTIVVSIVVVIVTIVVAVIPVRVHLASVSNPICQTPLNPLNILNFFHSKPRPSVLLDF